MRLLVPIVLILCLFPLPVFAQDGDCPAPLVETDGPTVLTTITPDGYVVYSAQWLSSGGTYGQSIHSVPLDGSAPPVELYYSESNVVVNGIFRVSPDGEYVTFAPTQHEVRVVRVVDGTVAMTLTLDETLLDILLAGPEFAPNGHDLLLLTGGELQQLVHVTFPSGEMNVITDRIARDWFLARNAEGWTFVQLADDGTPQVVYQQVVAPFTTTVLSGDLDVTRLMDVHSSLVFLATEDRAVFETSPSYDTTSLYAVTFDGQETTLLYTGIPSMEGMASPDGQWLAFSRGGVLWLVPLDGSAPAREIAQRFPYPVYQFTPDSQHLVYLDADSVLYFLPLDGGEPFVAARGLTFSENFLLNAVGDDFLLREAAPNGTRFASYILPGSLDDAPRLLFESVWDYQYGPFFMIDGDTLVYRQFDGEVTTFWQARAADDYAPVAVGCPLDGHARLLGLGDGRALIAVDNGAALISVPLD